MSIGPYVPDFLKNLLPSDWFEEPPPPRVAPASRPEPLPAKTAPTKPTPLNPEASNTLAPLRNWAHPVGDKGKPLEQLTHLAQAAGGYYPIGRNGLWHGGVHFDAGTAGIVGIDQSHVRCLADGEVVAYRIASRTPTTTYYPSLGSTPLEAQFASGFVLVRHKLQAPQLKDSNDTPPSLTFYSLYMHLQDWESYEKAPELPRPAVWAARTYRVKADVADPGPLGATVYAKPDIKSKLLGTLPRNTYVTVSRNRNPLGYYRLDSVRDINVPGLAEAISTSGAFVPSYMLEPAEGRFRVKSTALGTRKGDQLNIHAQANANSSVIDTLPRGMEVIISGEGAYRKLESVLSPERAGPGESDFTAAQGYLRFSALEPIPKPAHLDSVVILDPPIPIKAGALIGHIGPYQSARQTQPVHKLHLEVFTPQDMKTFLRDSRTWADRLPDEEKTWLKLAKGTVIIPHQAHYSAKLPPIPDTLGIASGTDLLIPRSLLDSLPAERKIQVKKQEGIRARNWYRLENLLNDDAGNLKEGWVCEEVGVTPWVSPWSWEGYEVIEDHHSYEVALARHRIATGNLSKEEEERLLPRADKWDEGPVPNRLYAIIDKDRNGTLSADEIQAALRIPAYAQSISQLIVRYESEWHYRQKKWDGLDDVIGHTTSTPALNSEAEKERVKELKWWDDVAGSLGLPGDGRVYHLHPVGLLGFFGKKSELIRVNDFLKEYIDRHLLFAPGTPELTQKSKENLKRILEEINKYYAENRERPNLYEIAYMLATARHEAYQPNAAEYFSTAPEYGPISYFNKYDPVLAERLGDRVRAQNHENTQEGDGYKYRGRGCVHLTWKLNYRKASEHFSVDFVSNPDLAAEFDYSVPIMIWGMASGIFTGKRLSSYINANKIDYQAARMVINGVDQKYLIASYAEKFEAILKKTSSLPEEFN